MCEPVAIFHNSLWIKYTLGPQVVGCRAERSSHQSQNTLTTIAIAVNAMTRKIQNSADGSHDALSGFLFTNISIPNNILRPRAVSFRSTAFLPARFVWLATAAVPRHKDLYLAASTNPLRRRPGEAIDDASRRVVPPTRRSVSRSGPGVART